MKKTLVFGAIMALCFDSFAAPRMPQVAGGQRAARAATNNTAQRVVNTAPRGRVPAGQTAGQTVQNATPNPAAATQQSTAQQQKKITTRAAKQNAIVKGTKVAAAAENTAVDQACLSKFEGCMDSFCMMENASGGRCVCSDRNDELNKILAEIEKLDRQSYQMATVGVEKIGMGEDADAIMNQAKKVANEVTAEDKTVSLESKGTAKRKTLDLSMWNNDIFDDEEEDIFGTSEDKGPKVEDRIGDKKGEELFGAAYKMCAEQMGECKSSLTMLTSMYKQRVRSYCAAYENSLKKQRDSSAQKLAAAETALREAALEQYRDANKYDLGQCTLQYKQCMQTTAGCGEDFSKCVDVRDVLTRSLNVNTGTGQTLKKTGTRTTTERSAVGGKNVTSGGYFTIKGSTTIQIAASTYNIIEGKKELCMNVTKNCVNVRDKVWDTFLREVAPQLKSAELIAESDLRTSCMSTISECFQKACKETMDPNDPEGSYDACLSRPENLRYMCKNEIDPCEAGIPKIMDFVVAKLASMRVDACTKEFKDCLTSEDRCGADYSNCYGLDTDTIIAMCDKDKLTACYREYKDNEESVDTALEKMAQGIFLNIDNSMYDTCKKIADENMIKVCGSAESCENLTVDENVGARSVNVKLCNGSTCVGSIEAVSATDASKYKAQLRGLINWSKVYFDNERKEIVCEGGSCSSILTNADTDEKNAFEADIKTLSQLVKNTLNTIEADTKLQSCISGRTYQSMGNVRKGSRKVVKASGNEDETTTTKSGSNEEKLDTTRFPNLTDQIRTIVADSVLQQAMTQYLEKYSKAVAEAIALDVKLTKKAGTVVSGDVLCRQKVADMYKDDGAWNYYKGVTVNYDANSKICSYSVTEEECKHTKHKFTWGSWCQDYRGPYEENDIKGKKGKDVGESDYNKRHSNRWRLINTKKSQVVLDVE
ncbi:MAG: hypothetical protein K5912_01945 [Alphaproteobacteria bacterium]|nr:hypothetical protein [Alphaproteobacteria bacterium]